MTAGSHGGGRIVRPPRPYRYSDAGSRLAISLGRVVPAPSSGAAPLIPRSRRSAARVLMDEGWGESNRGGEGGDKIPLCAKNSGPTTAAERPHNCRLSSLGHLCSGERIAICQGRAIVD